MLKKTYNNKKSKKGWSQSNEPVGEVMRNRRKELNLSLSEVVEQTRISRSNLVAIESDDFAALPANVFVKGQIILYCDFMGMDGNRIARDFLTKRSYQTPTPDNYCCDSSVRLSEPARFPSFPFAFILFILVLSSFVAIYFPDIASNALSVLKKQKEQVASDSMATLFIANDGRYIHGGDLLKETFVSPFVRDLSFKNNHDRDYVQVVLHNNDAK